MSSTALLWTLLALPGPTAAPGGEREDLACRIVTSVDSSVLDRWSYTPGEFRMVESKRVFRGQPIGAFLILEHYALDAQGDARLTYDVRITRPDGKPYHEQGGMNAHTGHAAPGDLLLAVDALFVSFDPPDPLGAYSIAMQVHDEVAGKSATATGEIELVEYVEGAAFERDEDLRDWVNGYFDHQEAERILPALDFFLGWKGRESLSLARGAFAQLLEGNPWLLPRLRERFDKADAAAREEILGLVAGSDEAQDFVAGLGAADARVWREISARRRDPRVDPIEGPGDVNELWGRYVVSRGALPLVRLFQALAPEETDVVGDATVHDPTHDTDVPLAKVVPIVVRRMLADAIAWDPIAKGYAEWMRAASEAGSRLHEELTSLLDG